MAKVVIYSKEYCPFCKAVKALFDSLDQAYENIDIAEHPERRDEMIEKANGRTTVPQVFVNGKHLGGNDDVQALHKKGQLQPLLYAEDA
ncbi:MAG: glutaredoxin 3 [Pseudomonadota bacterium]|nr:glutaredoxin 3 [Pseudomonadota bacterium]